MKARKCPDLVWRKRNVIRNVNGLSVNSAMRILLVTHDVDFVRGSSIGLSSGCVIPSDPSEAMLLGYVLRKQDAVEYVKTFIKVVGVKNVTKTKRKRTR